MRILLDTKPWLWWLNDDPRLAQRAREVIADKKNDIFVSVVSIWEILLKTNRSVAFSHSPHRSVKRWLSADGIRVLPLDLEQVLSAMVLPMIHDDPFDRVLVAQSRTRGLVLLSDQLLFERYDCEVILATDQGSR
jgi:PIN domain nuclease of toxin-antitoxin system